MLFLQIRTLFNNYLHSIGSYVVSARAAQDLVNYSSLSVCTTYLLYFLFTVFNYFAIGLLAGTGGLCGDRGGAGPIAEGGGGGGRSGGPSRRGPSGGRSFRGAMFVLYSIFYI